MKLSQHQMADRCYCVQFAFARAAKLSRLFILKICVGFVNHARQSFKFQFGKAKDVAALRAFDRGFRFHHKEVSSESPKFNNYLARIFTQEVAV